MALTNTQYNSIMREYEQRQLKNRRLLSERIRHAYALSPRLKEINDEIASISVAAARQRISRIESDFGTASVASASAAIASGSASAASGSASAASGSASPASGSASPALRLKPIPSVSDTQIDLHTRISSLRAEKQEILKQLSLPADYFDPIYDCLDCKDTGYIGAKKCHCLKQRMIEHVYEQSNIRSVLARENFSTLSYDYYSDRITDPATCRSPLASAKLAVAECHRFIDHFEEKPKNLLFYGDTGVGKTFLSNCVANELLCQGKSVIYFTSFQLFDILSKGVFDKDSDAIAANRDLFDCDLLIIDDLGTEMTNHFIASQFFLCVNERILRMKSTIISTNLGMEQLAELYSERTLSRILSNYVIIKLTGDDIRIRKRMAK